MPTAPAARNVPDHEPDRLVATRYRLKHAIGRGGMGVVWEAEDELLKRSVAVKEIHLPPAGTDSERMRLAERVLREARAAAQLGHHGAVTLYDVIEEEGITFIVMELVEARTVAELVREQGPLAPAVAADVGRQVLAALEAAHRRGIIHRDVKPGNVMVLPDGRSKLADFGIAKLGGDPDLTQTGMVMGSPSYIAPEQATGQRIGPATDLYGLGAMLYFAVEGEPPFERGPAIATLNAAVHEEPRPMERAGPLEPVISKLLRKDPEDRPTGETLRWMLDQVAGPTGASAPVGLATAGLPLAALGGPSAATPSGPADTQAIDRPAEPAAEPVAASAHEPAAPEHEPAQGQAATPDREPAQDDEPEADREPAPVGAAAPASADRSGSGQGQSGQTSRRLRPRQLAALLIAFVAVVGVTLSLDLILPDARGSQAEAPPNTAPPETTAAPDSTTESTAPPETTAAPGTTAAPQESETTAPPGGGGGGGGEGGDGDGDQQGPGVPADWPVYANESIGYRIAHPPGWQVRQAEANRVDLTDEAGGRYLRIDWSDQPKDPLEAWQNYEPRFASGRSGYERIRLEPTEFKGMEAAVWEYRYRDGGADLHAVNLTFVDDQGELAYALNFQTHEEDWEASTGLFEQLKASFQPGDPPA